MSIPPFVVVVLVFRASGEVIDAFAYRTQQAAASVPVPVVLPALTAAATAIVLPSVVI